MIGFGAGITYLIFKSERLTIENEFLKRQVNTYAYKLDELTNCER